MAFSYRRLFFGGTTFCCCMPVRVGVIIMTSLGCLVAGILMILLWFELATTMYMTTPERIAFVLAALTATVLFVASILGLVGSIARKQSFVQTYAYILDINFVLSIGIAAYFTFEVTKATDSAENLACLTAVKDAQAQNQCEGLLTFAKSVYLVVVAIVLLTELYCVIVATRYLNQLQGEKRAAKHDTEQAFQLKSRSQSYGYARLPDPAAQPLHPAYLQPSEFNPYEEAAPSNQFHNEPPPIEEGYGGGSWSHDGILHDEKERMKQEEQLHDNALYHDTTPQAHVRDESQGRTPTLPAMQDNSSVSVINPPKELYAHKHAALPSQGGYSGRSWTPGGMSNDGNERRGVRHNGQADDLM